MIVVRRFMVRACPIPPDTALNAAFSVRSGARVDSGRGCSTCEVAVKLLVVEDDRKIAAALARGLEAEGFTVDVTLDGQDGCGCHRGPTT